MCQHVVLLLLMVVLCMAEYTAARHRHHHPSHHHIQHHSHHHSHSTHHDRHSHHHQQHTDKPARQLDESDDDDSTAENTDSPDTDSVVPHYHESDPWPKPHNLPLLHHNTAHSLTPVSQLPLYGLCYHSPRAHDDQCPTMHQTYTEIRQLRRYTQHIRLYSLQQCNIVDILQAAQHLNMTVTATMYVTTQNQWNTGTADISFGMEKSVLLRLLDTQHALVKATITSILVGSEAMLRNELTATQLTNFVIDIQNTLWFKHFPWIQVSCADAYSAFVDPNRHDAKKLLNTVDYVSVHIYPFYEQIGVDDAVQHVDKALKQLRKVMNNDKRKIVITETGWPSDGHANGAAVPSPKNAYQYYSEFVCYARKHELEYFYFEGIDEAWKAGDVTTNGGDKLYTESHFGLLNEGDLQPKYPFDTLQVKCGKHKE